MTIVISGDNEGPVSAVWKQGGAEKQLSQPRSHSRPECRPLLKFVKAMELPDHVTLTT